MLIFLLILLTIQIILTFFSLVSKNTVLVAIDIPLETRHKKIINSYESILQWNLILTAFELVVILVKLN